jgi:hypothetical protein
MTVGTDIELGVVSGADGRLKVAEVWPGAHTTVRGRLVGLEWHKVTADGSGPGVLVDSTEDDLPEVDDYEFELTVATQDWLPR